MFLYVIGTAFGFRKIAASDYRAVSKRTRCNATRPLHGLHSSLPTHPSSNRNNGIMAMHSAVDKDAACTN